MGSTNTYWALSPSGVSHCFLKDKQTSLCMGVTISSAYRKTDIRLGQCGKCRKAYEYLSEGQRKEWNVDYYEKNRTARRRYRTQRELNELAQVLKKQREREDEQGSKT